MADTLGTQPSYRALVDRTEFNRPHVFILGAGASRAAFPNGELNGFRLPVMADLVETVGLADELDAGNVDWRGTNFEELYGRLAADAARAETVARIGKRIRSYLEMLRLPERPTLYDYLVLSLRPKDVVATFNWDPFLVDACSRNYWASDSPKTLFLHGNVRVGTCLEHKTAGPLPGCCLRCGKALVPSRLLFPIAEKNYDDDPYIAAQWRQLRIALKNAYILTIFGYGAPQSDIDAVALMKEAWGQPAERNLEEIEVIDIKPPEELRRTWRPFIHTHHYRTYGAWEECWCASFPRRTCEAMWDTLMELSPPSPSPVPLNGDLDAIQEWFMPLVAAERCTD